jgi:hypothetical protein
MLTIGNSFPSPQPVGVGHQSWTSPRVESLSVERSSGMVKDHSFLDDERQFLPWDDVGMGDMGVEASEFNDLWTFTDDMGWQSPPDSYFHEPGSPPNTLHFGDYWP